MLHDTTTKNKENIMIGEIIGGALTAAAGIGSSLINRQATRETNKSQYTMNKNLAEIAYKRNLEQWNRENLYNSPSAQMQRLRAAGLNPNLLYGNGQEASAGLAGDSPQLQYAEYNPRVPQLDLLPAAMAMAQVRNINADTSLKETQSGLNEANREVAIANIDKVRAEVRNLGLSGNAQEIVNYYLDDMQRSTISNITSDSYAKLSQARFNEAGVTLRENEVNEIKYKVEKLYDSQVKLNDSLAHRNRSEIEVNSTLIQKNRTECVRTFVEIGLKQREAELLVKDIENYDLNHMSNGLFSTGASLQNLARGGREAFKKWKNSNNIPNNGSFPEADKLQSFGELWQDLETWFK